MGIPVGSKLFSTAFAGEAVDRAGALPDLVPVLVPTFSPARIITEMTLPTSLWLSQKSSAEFAHHTVILHDLQICLHRFPVSV